MRFAGRPWCSRLLSNNYSMSPSISMILSRARLWWIRHPLVGSLSGLKPGLWRARSTVPDRSRVGFFITLIPTGLRLCSRPGRITLILSGCRSTGYSALKRPMPPGQETLNHVTSEEAFNRIFSGRLRTKRDDHGKYLILMDPKGFYGRPEGHGGRGCAVVSGRPWKGLTS